MNAAAVEQLRTLKQLLDDKHITEKQWKSATDKIVGGGGGARPTWHQKCQMLQKWCHNLFMAHSISKTADWAMTLLRFGFSAKIWISLSQQVTVCIDGIAACPPFGGCSTHTWAESGLLQKFDDSWLGAVTDDRRILRFPCLSCLSVPWLHHHRTTTVILLFQSLRHESCTTTCHVTSVCLRSTPSVGSSFRRGY